MCGEDINPFFRRLAMEKATKIRVTFKTKTGHEVIEVMDKNNGSTMDYKLRAMALGWEVLKVEVIE
jgi:hypothetical protein